jgi:hypothetical protein
MLLAVVMASAGCAVRRSGIAPGGNPMIVTASQIAKLHATTAYDVVTMTHDEFLHSRGREQFDPRIPATPPDVYLDDTFYGDVSTLREIEAGDIEQIRFWQSYDAQYKFGTNHVGGVIQVITKH